MSKVDAVPERMLDFLQIAVPDLTPLQRTNQAAACSPGVVTCGSMIAADKLATSKLHEFVTHMAQGITAYQTLVNDAAKTYADGAAFTENTIRAACKYDSAKMLPDIVPSLTTPKPA